MKTLIKNAQIVTLNETNEIIDNGDIVIENDTIVFVGKLLDNNEKFDNVIDATNKLVMPGFVNTHAHAGMSILRGEGENLELFDWLDKVQSKERLMDDTDIYNGVVLSIYEMLSNGITTFLDFYQKPQITAKAVLDTGINAVISVGAHLSTDVLTQSIIEDRINEVKKVLPNATISLVGHSVYVCDEGQFNELIKYAKTHNLLLTTHVSETLKEVGDCYNKYNLTPVGLLESYGFFDGTKTLLAHCVHCDSDDVNILSQYDVSISTNPSSNLFLGSGIAPIYSFVKNKINVCLGTDSAVSNNQLNLFKEMFLVDNLQAGVLNQSGAINTIDALKMATTNGALALGFNNRGVIKRGYIADLIILDTLSPNMMPNKYVYSNIVNACNSKNVYLTMVNGKVLYENGKYNLPYSLLELQKLVNESVKKLNF